MPHFVYILYSESRNRYYIGSCGDLDIRLGRHNAGANPSTKSGRPWKIAYHETCADNAEAVKREYYIKKMKSRIYLEALIAKINQGNSAG